MTGDALQDDIALTILGLRRRGQDILSGNTTARPGNAQTRGRNVERERHYFLMLLYKLSAVVDFSQFADPIIFGHIFFN